MDLPDHVSEMVLEECPMCRDEHEPSRGGKCKRARMPKWAIKAETYALEKEEPAPVTTGSAMAVAAVLMVDEATSAGGTGWREEKEMWLDYKEDDKEPALRKELAEFARAQWKAVLNQTVSTEKLKLSAMISGCTPAAVVPAVVMAAAEVAPDPALEPMVGTVAQENVKNKIKGRG